MPDRPVEIADLPSHEIVLLILQGDRQAYRHLVKRYQSDVLAIAHAMLTDQSHVEDVAQQVFIRAFESLARFELNSSFGHWIKGIARNVVREELRKGRRYQGRLETYAELAEQRLAGAGYDLFNQDVQEALNECLSGLEENAARAVRMHYIERRKTEEIGEILGRSSGAVRVLLHRARAVLRDCLIEKGAMP